MSSVTISKAATLVGKSRKTLYRHVSEGRLSVTKDACDKTLVDVSELIRVYGALRPEETNVTSAKGDNDTTRDTLERLTNELISLNAELRDRDSDIRERDIKIARLEGENSALMRLTDQSGSKPAGQKKSIVRRFRTVVGEIITP